MTWRLLLAAGALAALVPPAPAIDPRQRTDSGQFTIYCDDGNVRRQVAALAVKTRDDVLGLLDEASSWHSPIVVTVERLAGPLPAEENPVAFRVVETVVGLKIEIVARMGTAPTDVNLQKYLARAVLLELTLREPNPRGDSSRYIEPPWWVVDGTVELIRRRDTGVDSHFFRTLIETNKLPSIESFLADRPDELGPTALAVDRALAMGFVELLLDQPGGHHRLASLVRHWPASEGDAVGLLGREFPGLSGGAPALQKWWTLNLARLAAADRTEGLTPEGTQRELALLLEFDVPQKEGAPRHFSVGDFATYLKLPASRQVLTRQHAGIVALSVRANVLLRPVIAKYEECLALLARGKTGGVRDRLEQAGRLREVVARRSEEIADYLNWFEATQSGSRSNAFENYLRTASEVLDLQKQKSDPITRYLDEFEHAY